MTERGSWGDLVRRFKRKERPHRAGLWEEGNERKWKGRLS